MEKFNSSGESLTYLITDGTMTAETFNQKKSRLLKLIEIAVHAKISLIQIREKRLSARLVFELASEAAELTRSTETKLLVNDRADIALAANADGVHLTACSLAADVIKKNFPKNFIVGVSAHSIEAVKNARKQGADFAAFSPIFPTPGKNDAQGIETLRAVCQSVKPFPVIALGGVDATNFKEVLAAGASGIAAIRFLNDEKNLKHLFADMRG